MVDNENAIIEDIMSMIRDYAVYTLEYSSGPYLERARNRMYLAYISDRQYRKHFNDTLLSMKKSMDREITEIEHLFSYAFYRAKKIIENYKHNGILHNEDLLNIDQVFCDFREPRFAGKVAPPYKRYEDTEKLYFNPKPQYLDKVVQFIIDAYMDYKKDHSMDYTPWRPRVSFKFFTPYWGMNWMRADKVVLYSRDPNFLRFVIKRCGRLFSYMRPEIPRLTHKVFEGVGYAREPGELIEKIKIIDPELSGLNDPSFGEFVSRVILLRIHEFIEENRKIIFSRFEKFQVRFRRPEKRKRAAELYVKKLEPLIYQLAVKIYKEYFKKRYNWVFSP